MTEQVFESWSAYEYPMLVAIAKRAELATAFLTLPSDNLLDEVVTSAEDRYKFERAIVRLERSGHIEAHWAASGRPYPYEITSITELGLRSVGAWPNPDTVVQAVLEQLEEKANAIAVSAPENSARLKEAVRFFATVGRDVLVNVISGVATKAAGLP